jgi:hypothetical protein
MIGYADSITADNVRITPVELGTLTPRDNWFQPRQLHLTAARLHVQISGTRLRSRGARSGYSDGRRPGSDSSQAAGGPQLGQHPRGISVIDVRAAREVPVEAHLTDVVALQPVRNHGEDEESEHQTSHGVKSAPYNFLPPVAELTLYNKILPKYAKAPCSTPLPAC